MAHASPDESPGYPGQGLGLPETGQGSVASQLRRLGALVIDWLLCTFIVMAFIRPIRADVEYWTLLIFAVQDIVLTAFTGYTVGKRLMGIRVARLDGKMIGPLWSLVRTVMLLLIVPPLVINRDVRGLHDRAANTVVVRI
jgi:uncharacterized RDD family membrane protein YckC